MSVWLHGFIFCACYALALYCFVSDKVFSDTPPPLQKLSLHVSLGAGEGGDRGQGTTVIVRIFDKIFFKLALRYACKQP